MTNAILQRVFNVSVRSTQR